MGEEKRGRIDDDDDEGSLDGGRQAAMEQTVCNILLPFCAAANNRG